MVITFSRHYQKKHPLSGEPTFFVEKIWRGLDDMYLRLDSFYPLLEYSNDLFLPKLHTIRAGHRFKEGDYFSPRVWSEKPYKSKQIQFAPNLLVVKIYSFQRIGTSYYLNGNILSDDNLYIIAQNDGLSLDNFKAWFQGSKKDFDGQIICWDNVNY